MLDIKELEALKEELEGYEKEKLRREERLKHLMAELKKLGFGSIEEAESGQKELLSKVQRLEVKLEDDYNTFLDNYEELFAEDK